MDSHPSTTYSVLHNVESETVPNDTEDMGDDNEMVDDDEFDEIELHHHQHHPPAKKQVFESFDFTDVESIMWRKFDTIASNSSLLSRKGQVLDCAAHYHCLEVDFGSLVRLADRLYGCFGDYFYGSTH
eukprot:scaffold11846_cov149-Ochromonas_danica.AAC.13